MAHDSILPCDSDGVCMICKQKPPEEETLNCKTCATPWHLNCLSSSSSRPKTLADVPQWECPDCSDLTPTTTNANAAASSGSEASSALIAAIRAIESDASLTDDDKAKKRQQLLSGGGEGDDKSSAEKMREKEVVNADSIDVLKLLAGSFNCSFCMQLPDRPVTTPCGHNFCLKCFEKWVGQGKRTCAICRTAIPAKMASQPRINSSLVIAIRMAKMTKSNAAAGPAKAYHCVLNQNRPDKAFTTERAKKAGKANACSGKIFVTVPPDHFGPILAENDPEREMGVLVGETWEDRMECRQWGAHLPHVAGISGQSEYGAQSVALSGGYEDDEDHGEWFLYTGSGGRDLSGNKRTNKTQSFDQKFEKSNEALRVSCRKGYPVRVVRSHKEKRSSYAPEKGVRYDGIYRIEKCWRKPGIQGFKVCRYLFVRCDNDPAPWTSDDHGDQPRPLPVIKELKSATDITERKGTPSWDYDEEKSCWLWKLPPPESRRHGDYGNTVDGTSIKRVKRKFPMMSVSERLLKEFSCLICHKVMVLPLTTPCAHNFCKTCLEGAFAGQTFVRERTCEGRRTLRAQKNIMKCPSCSNDISEYLQNPQVNRELMSVIESLQSQSNEADDMEMGEESSDLDEKKEDALEETDEMNEKSEAVVGVTDACDMKHEDLTEKKETEECIRNPSPQKKPKRTSKNKKADDGGIIPETDDMNEKSEAAVGVTDACDMKPEDLTEKKDTEECIRNPSPQKKPKRTSKNKKADDGGIIPETDDMNEKSEAVVGVTDACDTRPEDLTEKKDTEECITNPSPQKKPKHTCKKKKADDGGSVPENEGAQSPTENDGDSGKEISGIEEKSHTEVGITDDLKPETMVEDKDGKEGITNLSPQKKSKQTRKKKADAVGDVPEKTSGDAANPIEAQAPKVNDKTAEVGGTPRRSSQRLKGIDVGVKTRSKK